MLHQTVSATKQRGEISRVNKQNISRARLTWRHPEQAVESRVTRLGERVWSVEINRLAR